MEAKISKHYSYKLQAEVFKIFLIFFINGPQRIIFGIFQILKIENCNICFFVFIRMGQSGSKTFKTYSSYKLHPELFKLTMIPPMVLANLRWDFRHFRHFQFLMFNDYFS